MFFAPSILPQDTPKVCKSKSRTFTPPQPPPAKPPGSNSKRYSSLSVIIVRPCLEEGHSIWQFQEGDRESYPKAIYVPVNPRKEIADRAFYAAPMLRHVEIAAGIKHVGFAAWQGCQQLQIVKLPPSVISLEDGAFQGCYVLREITAPGCVQYSRRVFAECCSLSKVGVGKDAEDINVLAPGAQLGRYAFESCLTLTSITFAMDQTNK